MIKFRKGLELPITGAPKHTLALVNQVDQFALLGTDYVGLKPTMKVKVGEHVAQGQVLFEDKKNPGIHFVSPVAGVVESINRGERRVFQSIVIASDKAGAEGAAVDKVTFPLLTESDLMSINRSQMVDRLAESGLWTALRTRPFSLIPARDSEPSALFINTMDTNPLAVDAGVVLDRNLHNGNEKASFLKQDFVFGQRVLQKLTKGPVFVCASPKSDVPVSAGVQLKRFEGPHPSGLVGSHIHVLHPVHANKTVWHIGYQDVIAIGALCRTGSVDFSRFVSLAGPQVKDPKIVSTTIGANLDQLTAGLLKAGENRIISGSILSGHPAKGVSGYLGRYHQQVSVLLEGRDRGFLEYLVPGARKHSVLPVFLSKWLGEDPLPLTTTTNGSARGMVPVGAYEKVMPLDILPTQLLRSLIVGDTEMAQALGCLELDEEDLGLCTYVCPSKYDYGPILRSNLLEIEKDG